MFFNLRTLSILLTFTYATSVNGQILKIGHQSFNILQSSSWTPFPSVIVLNETDIITNYVGSVALEEIDIANDWIWYRRSLNPDGLNVTVNVRNHGFIGPNFLPPESASRNVTAVSSARKSNHATVIFVFDSIAGTIIDIDKPPDTTEDWNGDPFYITNTPLQDYDSSLTALPLPPDELDQFEAIYGARNGTHICVYSVIFGQRNAVQPSQLLFCPGTIDDVNNTYSRAWLDPNNNNVFYVTSAYPNDEFHTYKCINDQSNNAFCTSVTQATLPRAITQSHGKIMKGSNIFLYVGTSDNNPIEVIAIDYVANMSYTLTVPTTSITGPKAIGLIDATTTQSNSITMLVYDRSTQVFQVIDLVWNSTTSNLTYEKTVPDFGPVDDMYPIVGTEVAAASQGNSSFAIATGEALNDTAVYITQFFRRLYCGDGFVLFDEECDSEAYCDNATCQCFAGLVNNACNPYTPPIDVPVDMITPQPNNETGLATEPVGVEIEVVVPSVVIPVVVAAVGVVLLVVLLKRRNRQKKANDEHKMSLRGSGTGQASPYFGVPSERIVALANTSTNTTNTTTDDNRLDIPYSELKFIREIGSGSFGKVFIGEWQKTSVALKISVVTSTKEFTREAELLINLRPHPNVVQVLGLSTDGVHVVMIMEFCDGGSLDSLVFKKNPPMSDKIHLLSGIAKGIYHLHKNKIVHRDLAARNVLLLRGEPKISDFGMSRKLKEATEHGQTNNSVGPLRWMAPESLRSMEYSTKTDVWSFGILCWEVLSGEEPHLNTDALTIGAAIRDQGATPAIDAQWDTELQSLLKDCWALDPEQRPEFDEICERLQAMDQ